MILGLDVAALVRRTLFEPRAAAAELIALGVPTPLLWQALALMSALNALLYGVGLVISPPLDAEVEMMPPMMHSPLLFGVVLYGALVLSVMILRWVGQSLGGTAQIGDILVLVTWLQALRVGVQVAAIVLGMVLPGLAVVLMLGATLWGIFILVGFIAAAHGFEGWLKAIAVLIGSMLGVAVGLSFALSLLAAITLGGG